MKKIAYVLLLVLILSGCSGAAGSHFKNLWNHPPDLFNKYYVEDVKLHEKGFEKTFSITPKYKDYYSFAFLLPGEEIRKFGDDKRRVGSIFDGRIKVQIIEENKIIQEDIVEEPLAVHFEKDGDIYSLNNFPVSGKTIKVRIEVLEPIVGIKKYGDNADLQAPYLMILTRNLLQLNNESTFVNALVPDLCQI